MENTEKLLFPPLEPYETGFLEVGDGHQLYYEVSGNPLGIPFVNLHGGPGGANDADTRRLADPEKYQIILFDARGNGRSQCLDPLRANTLQTHMADMEALRIHLGVETWLVMGRSWGSTLALSYAKKYPERVSGLLLVGVFLARQEEGRWLQSPWGAAQFYPEAYQDMLEAIGVTWGEDVLPVLDQLMLKDTPKNRAAALAHLTWEGGLCKMPRFDAECAAPAADVAETTPDPAAEAAAQQALEAFLYTMTRIQHHFQKHGFFLQQPVLEGIEVLADVPVHLVHGRYDLVCPPAQAWDLHRALPQSTLTFLPLSAHSTSEPQTRRAVMEILQSIAVKEY